MNISQAFANTIRWITGSSSGENTTTKGKRIRKYNNHAISHKKLIIKPHPSDSTSQPVLNNSRWVSVPGSKVQTFVRVKGKIKEPINIPSPSNEFEIPIHKTINEKISKFISTPSNSTFIGLQTSINNAAGLSLHQTHMYTFAIALFARTHNLSIDSFKYKKEALAMIENNELSLDKALTLESPSPYTVDMLWIGYFSTKEKHYLKKILALIGGTTGSTTKGCVTHHSLKTAALISFTNNYNKYCEIVEFVANMSSKVSLPQETRAYLLHLILGEPIPLNGSISTQFSTKFPGPSFCDIV